MKSRPSVIRQTPTQLGPGHLIAKCLNRLGYVGDYRLSERFYIYIDHNWFTDVALPNNTSLFSSQKYDMTQVVGANKPLESLTLRSLSWIVHLTPSCPALEVPLYWTGSPVTHNESNVLRDSLECIDPGEDTHEYKGA